MRPQQPKGHMEEALHRIEFDDYFLSETDVLVELCHRLKLQDIKCRCEVKMPSRFHRSGQMRCDVVVLHERRILCVIEVKNDRKHVNAWHRTLKQNGGELQRQARAYKDLEDDMGIPVLWVRNIEQIDASINRVKALARAKTVLRT